jgi:MYXO-CTERM domain-containing protein
LFGAHLRPDGTRIETSDINVFAGRVGTVAYDGTSIRLVSCDSTTFAVRVAHLNASGVASGPGTLFPSSLPCVEGVAPEIACISGNCLVGWSALTSEVVNQYHVNRPFAARVDESDALLDSSPIQLETEPATTHSVATSTATRVLALPNRWFASWYDFRANSPGAYGTTVGLDGTIGAIHGIELGAGLVSSFSGPPGASDGRSPLVFWQGSGPSVSATTLTADGRVAASDDLVPTKPFFGLEMGVAAGPVGTYLVAYAGADGSEFDPLHARLVRVDPPSTLDATPDGGTPAPGGDAGPLGDQGGTNGEKPAPATAASAGCGCTLVGHGGVKPLGWWAMLGGVSLLSRRRRRSLVA